MSVPRLWLAGEHNILADAPSRAPADQALAEHLPPPNLPIGQIIHHFWYNPQKFDQMLADRCVELGLSTFTPVAKDSHYAHEYQPPINTAAVAEREPSAPKRTSGRLSSRRSGR